MKSFAVTISAGVLFASTGLGATLGTYEFASSSSESPTVANGTLGSATMVGLNDVSTPGFLGLSGFTTSGTSDLGQFVQFTFSPNPTYTLTITGFQWNSSRDAQGPQSVYLRLFDGTNPANDDVAIRAAAYQPGTSPATITYNFSGGGTSSDDGFTLRLYGFSAGAASGTLSIDRLTVFGEITGSSIPVVPEPGTASLALCGLALIGAKKLRRSR
jgi:hypothetical protein